MLFWTHRRTALIFFLLVQVIPVAAQTAMPEGSTPPQSAPVSPLLGEDARFQAPLDFDQLLQLARLRNPAWAAALAGPRAVEGELLQAGMTPNPQVSIRSSLEVPLQFESGGMSLSQEIELGGKRQARKAAASARLEVARQKALEIERQLRLELHTAYADLLYARSLEELRGEVLAATEASLKLTQGRLEAGDVAGVDVLQLQGDLALRGSEMAEATGRVLSASTRLTRLIGEALGATVTITGELGARSSVPELAELHRLASRRPDFLQANAEAEAAQREIAVQRTSGISNLTASLGLDRERLLIDEDSISPRGLIHGIDDRSWVASIQLSIPIPINDTNEGNIVRAQALADGARLERDVAQQKVHTEVSQAFIEWQAAVRTVQPLQETALQRARQAYEIVEQAYRLGQRSLLDVLQARQEYLQLRLTRLEALRSLELSMARLEAAVGVPIGEHIP